MSRRGERFAMGCAALTVLTVAATGCSSGGSSSASPTPPAPTTSVSTTSAALSVPSVPSTSTSSVPTTSASVSQSSGSYLKTLLPTTATESMLGLGPTLPTGWVAHPTDEHDSGDTATAPKPSLVSPDNCDYLTAQNLDLAGGLSVATATEPLSSGTEPAGVAFYAYRPGEAAKSFAQVRQNLASACDGFTAIMNSIVVNVDVSATPVHGIGDEALLVKVTPHGAYVDQENLIVRRGNLMMSLWSDNLYGDFPDLSPVATALVTGLG